MGALFDGEVAIVTGGSAGIGRATAIAFAEEGARVVIGDIDAEGGAETLRLIRDAGGEAHFLRTDVREKTEVDRLVAEAVTRYGRLDCAFNNAGIALETMETEWGELDPFLKIFAVNVTGVMLCMAAEIKQMRKQGTGGSIVNTASVAGMAGMGGAGYCGSKHAVIGLTRSAAMQFANDKIRVNAVCPGAIPTAMTNDIMAADPRSRAFIEAMHPMNRMGTVREVADAVLWLSSKRASFTTGHPLAVDGGVLAR